MSNPVPLGTYSKIVKQYQNYEIGYDTAIAQLIQLGLTEVQADRLLFLK